MKAFIKPMQLEVEIARLPYRNNQNLKHDNPDFVIEATDGRIFTVPKYSDLIIEHESYTEKVDAEAELEAYYHKCAKYRWHYVNNSYNYGMTLAEFAKTYPFDRFK